MPQRFVANAEQQNVHMFASEMGCMTAKCRVLRQVVGMAEGGILLLLTRLPMMKPTKYGLIACLPAECRNLVDMFTSQKLMKDPNDYLKSQFPGRCQDEGLQLGLGTLRRFGFHEHQPLQNGEPKGKCFARPLHAATQRLSKMSTFRYTGLLHI